jgi:hypothetical protein
MSLNSSSFYSIVCPECHGKMFIGHTICGKCSGDGRLLIPELPDQFIPFVSPRLVRLAIIGALLVLVAIAILLKVKL